MADISGAILDQVLEIRKKNGLEPTKEAVLADLTASKAKWTVSETPRYRTAGTSPIWISGKYLTKTGVCPATGEKEEGRAPAPAVAKRAKAVTETAPAVDATAFYRVLHGKGFKVSLLRDEITGELREEVPAAISALKLKFGAIPALGEDAVYVTQTTPQIQVSMTLDKLLQLTGTKP